MARYKVGCAGQFVLYGDGTGHLHGEFDDVDEAIAACDTGPIGCEVYDADEGRWIGPGSRAEIDEAKAALAARAIALEGNLGAPGRKHPLEDER
jgi:hypothetical protein